jgi:lysophospholipase L1-like esterase
VDGVAVLSMQDVVCPGDQCRSVVQGKLVRFDGQHFTADGARWFAQRLQPRLP